jgi:hypothetical protein
MLTTSRANRDSQSRNTSNNTSYNRTDMDGFGDRAEPQKNKNNIRIFIFSLI